MKLRSSWPADRSLGGEAILWESFIEVSEVDADLSLTIFLVHEDRIGEPVGEGLSDKVDL